MKDLYEKLLDEITANELTEDILEMAAIEIKQQNFPQYIIDENVELINTFKMMVTKLKYEKAKIVDEIIKLEFKK